MTTTPRTHLTVLLDRSGSMSAIRDDVIGGFNDLLADQRAAGDDARMTLVQFDSQEPHEVLVEAKRITRVRPLSRATYVPRGGTPLLDAVGRTITVAKVREEQRRQLGKRPEHVIIAVYTDGEENQSTTYRRADIARLVAQQQAAGWTFTFLGAGIDAYGEAGGMGIDARSVQACAADAPGAAAAFGSLSRAVVARRSKLRAGESFEAADLYEGAKDAEADLRRRQPGA